MSFIPRTHPQQGGSDIVDDRATPTDLFQEVAELVGHGFDIDVAAAPHNTKCERFYTRADDGLLQPWFGHVWCNPPYSLIRPWIERALGVHPPLTELVNEFETVTFLLPANRTEQGWWQELIEPVRDRPSADVVVSTHFIKGRRPFLSPGDTHIKPNARAPFGLVVVHVDRRTP